MLAIFSVRHLRRNDAAAGLTLVELLVTIMIIGILSSSVLFAMSAAQEAARKSRTQALIATLHSIVIDRWESYLTRRTSATRSDELASTGPRAAATIRLKKIRQLLKMDFPDQWQDIEYMNQQTDRVLDVELTGLHRSYAARRNRVLTYIGSIPGLTAAAQKELLEQNEGAECLYWIVELARGDASQFQMIPSIHISDIDSDSSPEFIDGWGRPISFIRWPAGFISELQMGCPGVVSPHDSGRLDHDPFDPLRADLDSYRMVPLIISAGADGLFDVSLVELQYDPPNDTDMDNRWLPYYAKTDLLKRRAGETWDQNDNKIEDWHDNIHNHLISTR